MYPRVWDKESAELGAVRLWKDMALLVGRSLLTEAPVTSAYKKPPDGMEGPCFLFAISIAIYRHAQAGANNTLQVQDATHSFSRHLKQVAKQLKEPPRVYSVYSLITPQQGPHLRHLICGWAWTQRPNFYNKRRQNSHTSLSTYWLELSTVNDTAKFLPRTAKKLEAHPFWLNQVQRPTNGANPTTRMQSKKNSHYGGLCPRNPLARYSL